MKRGNMSHGIVMTDDKDCFHTTSALFDIWPLGAVWLWVRQRILALLF